METTTKEVKHRLSFKDKQIEVLEKHIRILKKRISKYDKLANELRECEEALKSFKGKSSSTIEVPRDTTSPPKDNIESSLNPENKTPLSEEGIKKLLKLPARFNADDLTPLLNNSKTQAFQWIAVWKNKGWITTYMRGVYDRVHDVEVAYKNLTES